LLVTDQTTVDDRESGNATERFDVDLFLQTDKTPSAAHTRRPDFGNTFVMIVLFHASFATAVKLMEVSYIRVNSRDHAGKAICSLTLPAVQKYFLARTHSRETVRPIPAFTPQDSSLIPILIP